MIIKQALQVGIEYLAAIPDARLDAEVLLAEVLQKSRGYLHAWPEQELPIEIFNQYYQWIQRRSLGEPIAYILGYQEFWSLSFKVNSNTLIPRPDTESVVEQVLELLPEKDACLVADLGTGSGCIALSVAHERPLWELIATDCSALALDIAQENAQRLQIKNVQFHLSQWCLGLPKRNFAAILSNPPYIDALDTHLAQKELQYEPQNALISEMNGLQDIQLIILQAKEYLAPGGWLVLEHGYNQGQEVKSLLKQAGYSAIQTKKDYGSNDRVAIARYL